MEGNGGAVKIILAGLSLPIGIILTKPKNKKIKLSPPAENLIFFFKSFFKCVTKVVAASDTWQGAPNLS